MRSVSVSLPAEFDGARLRRMRASDLAAFQRYRSMPALARFQAWSPMTDAEARAFLAEASGAPLFVPGAWVQLAIADAGSDVLIGDVGLHLAEDGRTGEVGITLQPESQGRGIATRALARAVDLLFAGTDARQVYGIADSRNAASVRLLERAGFEYRESRAVVFRDEPCVEQVYVRPRSGV